MEVRNYCSILDRTRNNLAKTDFFDALWIELSKVDKCPRIYAWLDFMNSTFNTCSIVHFDKTIIAILCTFYSTDVLQQQTEHEFYLSKEFYKIFFQNVRNNCMMIDDIGTARKLLIISYLYSRYHGMMQYSIHKQLSLLSNFVYEKHLTEICIKSFVKYETPHYLISNIDSLNSDEIQFLMEGLQGNNLRKSNLFPTSISKQEFSALMTMEIGPHRFTSDIILRAIILIKIANGREADFNLIFSFLISSKTFKKDPLIYFQDIEYWKKAFFLLADFFGKDDKGYYISRAVDFLEYERYNTEKSFSLKGRTTKSLIQIIDAWHQSIYEQKFTEWRKYIWEKSPYSDLAFSLEGINYSCQELCTGELIFQEGQSLKHCVMTYVNACAQKGTTIWSMKKQVSARENFSSFLTIEVSENKIMQVRGLKDAAPKKKEKKIIRHWSKCMGFAITSY